MTGFLTTDARPLTDALRNVALFVRTPADVRRYAGDEILGAVLVEYAEGRLTMAATDRYQLAYQILKIDAGSEPFAFTLQGAEAARIASTHGAAKRGVCVMLESLTEMRIESDKGTTVHPIDRDGPARFVPWRRIAEKPVAVAVSEVAFTGLLLARLAKIKINGAAPTEVRMILAGPGKPAHCQVEDGPAIVTMTRKG